ncbi:MAG: hypothetical protein D9V47_11735 [Clostridia bacterium]|nr:MAG: hypothetical protein D9V47_11735 [Clostridia bacterium]
MDLLGFMASRWPQIVKLTLDHLELVFLAVILAVGQDRALKGPGFFARPRLDPGGPGLEFESGTATFCEFELRTLEPQI